MKVDAIRALSSADLNAQLLALKEEQMRLRFQLATNQVPSHATIRTSKRTSPGSTRSCANARWRKHTSICSANAGREGKTERW